MPRTQRWDRLSGAAPTPCPPFIGDVFVDRVARCALLAGTVALCSEAMDPRPWNPLLPSIQGAVREIPQVETAFLLGSISASGLILHGGAAGDSRRGRPVILGGPFVELLANVAALLVPVGPVFFLARSGSSPSRSA